jgi:AcrR family transcriptional regulator
MERRAAGRRRSDARWAAVLDAASRVFADSGYEKATLDDVASEVGINRATLYYYVGTKEELLLSLLTEPIATVTATLEEVAKRNVPADIKLTAALRDYVKALDEHPELFIFLRENLDTALSSPEVHELVTEADQYARILTAVISDGQKSGVFRKDVDPETSTHAILGMFNSMHRWCPSVSRRSLIETGEALIRLALAALEPPN